MAWCSYEYFTAYLFRLNSRNNIIFRILKMTIKWMRLNWATTYRITQCPHIIELLCKLSLIYCNHLIHFESDLVFTFVLFLLRNFRDNGSFLKIVMNCGYIQTSLHLCHTRVSSDIRVGLDLGWIGVDVVEIFCRKISSEILKKQLIIDRKPFKNNTYNSSFDLFGSKLLDTPVSDNSVPLFISKSAELLRWGVLDIYLNFSVSKKSK